MDVIRSLRAELPTLVLIFLPVLMLATPFAATPALAGRPDLTDAPVVWYDDDSRDIPEPPEREPNLFLDMLESSLFGPVGRTLYPPRQIRNLGTLFGGDHVQAAANINTLDEVPNSTWFTNRIGLYPLDPAAVARGPGHGRGPDRGRPWTIVRAKTEGVTPGFTIRDALGELYLIKFDPPGHPSIASAAGVISGRILYAAGYNVPDDAVIHFAREELAVGPAVWLPLADGSRRTMTENDVTALLEPVFQRTDGKYRAIASKFLSGTPVGPFNYQHRRSSDANDRIDHENRRELRGLRTIAAWLFHFDTKQGNSLDMFVEEDGRHFIRHYLIDFASTLGTGANGPVSRFNHEYTSSVAGVFTKLVTLGFHEVDWRKIERPTGLDEIGYFTSDPYDPREFRPLIPNPAFANRTDRDGYWAAKIISAFTDEQLAAIVKQGKYYNPAAAQYLTEILSARRDIIARTYFDRVPPLDFFVFADGVIVFHDLGVERDVYPPDSRYRTRLAGCGAERKTAAWTAWQETETTRVDIAAAGPATAQPFLAIECQVDRGDGWSRSITVYLATASNTIVAVDR